MLQVYICEMEMDVQVCLKRNIHKRTEDEINKIVDYFEPMPANHHKIDVDSMLQEQSIEDVCIIYNDSSRFFIKLCKKTFAQIFL